MQTPRKPRLTSRWLWLHQDGSPGTLRTTLGPPGPADSAPTGDFTGMSRFPAGKGPTTPLFTRGCYRRAEESSLAPTSQLEPEITHCTSFLLLKFPARLRAWAPTHPLLLYNENALKNSFFFFRNGAAECCCHQVPPCSGRARRGCGPNGGFGDRYSPLLEGFHPFWRSQGSLAALSSGVRVGVSWARTQRVSLPQDGRGPLGTDTCRAHLWFGVHPTGLAPHPTPGCDLISPGFPKNLPHTTEGTSKKLLSEVGTQDPVTLWSPGTGGTTAELPSEHRPELLYGEEPNAAVTSSQLSFLPASKIPLPACPFHLVATSSSMGFVPQAPPVPLAAGEYFMEERKST